MSDKQLMEDKAMDHATMPRPCQQLISTTEEVRAALTSRHDKLTISSAVELLEEVWKKAMKANLVLSSQGGPPDQLVAYAEALNTANEVIGQAKYAMR